MGTTDTPITAPETPPDDRQLHAEIAGKIAVLLVGHSDHPAIQTAANVAGLMTGVALVVGTADGHGVDPSAGLKALPFISKCTVEAALLMLASSAISAGMSSTDVLKSIPETIESILEG